MKSALGAAPVTTQLVEQRGGHVFVALRSATGAAECLAPATSGRVAGGTGSSGPEGPPLGPREAEVWGPGVQGGPQGAFAFTGAGRVGSDVTGVIIRTQGEQISATVANGEYIAWWPTQVDRASEPVTLDISVDVTYADGTVARDHTHRPEMRRPGPTELGRVSDGRGIEGARTSASPRDGWGSGSPV